MITEHGLSFLAVMMFIERARALLQSSKIWKASFKSNLHREKESEPWKFRLKLNIYEPPGWSLLNSVSKESYDSKS